MSDFLARLGAQALGASGGVRPAIAPLFLSRPSWPALQGPHQRADDMALDPEAVVPGDPAAAPRAEPPGRDRSGAAAPGMIWPRPMARAADSHRDDETLGGAPASPSRASGPATLVTGQPAPPQPHHHATPPLTARGEPESAAPPPRAPIAPAAATGTSRRASAAPRRGDPAGAADSPSGPSDPGGERFAARSFLPGSRRPAVPDVVARDRRAVAEAPAVAGALDVSEMLARLRRLAATPAPARASGGPAATERVVRISIGRIDVRAVPPPAPAPAAARPPESARPRLSLADYLAKKGRA